MSSSSGTLLERVRRLNAIGVALSAERDTERLLERILESARELTCADGGTLYLRAGEHLVFEIMLTESLGIRLGGTSGTPAGFDPLPLWDDAGRPNHTLVAAHATLTRQTVSIADAYQVEAFDFTGTRAFDAKTGYRSKSFLTVPMINHQQQVIGVLQLINARPGGDGAGFDPENAVPFSGEDQELVESLASQAAVALTNQRLLDDQRRLFEAFIELIAGAIDDKSPYTGGHCRRVPELTMMLAEAAAATGEGPLADFSMSDEDRYELQIAGWLHDCGKITTPEYVVDKATKLETIHDRIHEVAARFAVLRCDAEARMLRDVRDGADPEARAAELEAELRRLDRDLALLRRCNIGGEVMADADVALVQAIARRRWRAADGEERPLLSEDEVDNLTVRKGTLTPAERAVINDHIVATIKMLEALPFPPHLARVPEYAGGHHERMDGRGYPRGLTREQMSVQARVMGIADVFEALTAKDRPYKPGMKLSRALAILEGMKRDNHVDPDLLDVFVREKVYLRYAHAFLDPDQIDCD